MAEDKSLFAFKNLWTKKASTEMLFFYNGLVTYNKETSKESAGLFYILLIIKRIATK